MNGSETEAQGGRVGKPYRVRIPVLEQDKLEKVPLDVALRMEQHLQNVADMAERFAPQDPRWIALRDGDSGLFRFDVEGFSMRYELDRADCIIVVRAVTRLAGVS